MANYSYRFYFNMQKSLQENAYIDYNIISYSSFDSLLFMHVFIIFFYDSQAKI